ncbi:MAG: hypothetical protein P1T08_12810 [Acidimicrobiia bacterium]|nr:hypothetical protein [Acidimicrobiia bacterium]
MPLNDALLNIGAAAMQGAATHLQIHTAIPDAAGSNEATSARQPITWEAAANGDMIALVDLPFTGGAASGPATHVGFWSALTVGTFYGWLPTTGDQAFNAAGEYTVTGISIPGTAT